MTFMPLFLMGSTAIGELKYSINFLAPSKFDAFVVIAAAKV
jgi:hypothetical protein